MEWDSYNDALVPDPGAPQHENHSIISLFSPPSYITYPYYVKYFQTEGMLMEGTRVVKTRTNQNLGNTVVSQEEVIASNTINNTDYSIAKTHQVVWFFAHIIAILLTLRFLFLLLGANLTGIVMFIYSLSSVFVLPFRGVFPSPRSGESFFDTATLLGILMYYLIAYIISHALRLSSRRVTALD